MAELVAQAQTASSAGDWSQAASLLETAYQLEQSFTINHQLVTALTQIQNYAAASTYAAEFETTYLATGADFNLYLTICLANHEFIKAHMLIQAIRQQHVDWVNPATEQVTIAEAQAEQTLQQTLTTTMRQFYHLSDQPVAEQPVRLAAAQHLTLAKYVTAARFLLLDPFLQQLSRVEVLYTLRAAGVTQPVQFLWFDQTEVTVVPAELPVIGTDATSVQVEAALQAAVGQLDVSLYESLQAMLSLQLMYLYPYSEKIITDSQIWINLLITSQQGQTPRHLTVTGQEMLANQTKIQEMNAELG
ncbi:hypothetical protein [Lactiplantibacillus daowaiensis]|uniref:TPR repeat-containing protein n=1 Tax=Lactiplantibacillus daowaiensis TaxID=2559918 RepID=A0ABW1RZ98_9LACO|nr:hypothetical protein [Lactiplantibacillus daowaiensis]